MKENEVVVQNEEEEEGIAKFCDILTYTQTDTVHTGPLNYSLGITNKKIYRAAQRVSLLGFS